MAIARETAVAKVEWRRARVSQNRQVTIPRRFFDKLGIKDEVEFGMQDGYLIIRPVVEITEPDYLFTEYILEDLINEGFNGEELREEFHNRLRQIRPAVSAMLDEADQAAKNYKGDDETLEIFADVMED